jgi:hypothetical protein
VDPHHPAGKSEFEAWRDEESDPPVLVVQVGSTQLRYQLRCIDDLHAMLKSRGDWMPLGNADEQKAAAEGTVEATTGCVPAERRSRRRYQNAGGVSGPSTRADAHRGGTGGFPQSSTSPLVLPPPVVHG